MSKKNKWQVKYVCDGQEKTKNVGGSEALRRFISLLNERSWQLRSKQKVA